MGKKKRLTLLFLGLMWCFMLVGAWNNYMGEEGVSFGVIGDIHNNKLKLEKVIMEYYNINPNMDGVILNGDIVDQGKEQQYNNINNVLNSKEKYLPREVIKNIGNHEYYDYELGENTKNRSDEFLKRNLNFTGFNKPYGQKNINGYNFIFLGSEETYTKKTGVVNPYISKIQKEWLKEVLEKKYEKGKPIFIFLHQPIFSPNVKVIEEDKDESISDVISKYNEVIMFYSHNHTTLKQKDIHKEKNIIMVNTGAVDYTLEFKDGKVINRDNKMIYGLYVEVKGNKVIIKGRDFYNSQWVFEKNIPKEYR